MRKNNYLNDPYNDSPIKSLGSNKTMLNPELLNIRKIAKKQKIDNILKVIRYNDFESGYSRTGNIRIIEEKSDKVEKVKSLETQIKILIESEDDFEKKRVAAQLL